MNLAYFLWTALIILEKKVRLFWNMLNSLKWGVAGSFFRSPNLGLWTGLSKGIYWKDPFFGSLFESLFTGPYFGDLKKTLELLLLPLPLLLLLLPLPLPLLLLLPPTPVRSVRPMNILKSLRIVVSIIDKAMRLAQWRRVLEHVQHMILVMLPGSLACLTYCKDS